MVKLGIILTKHYRLLSVAAILDIFESVNSIYRKEDKGNPFLITMISSDESARDTAFSKYPVSSLERAEHMDLLLIPAFSTENIKNAIHENEKFIPWLKARFEAGTEIATFCTGAFLLGATGMLNGRHATTHIDACEAFSLNFPDVRLLRDKVVTGDNGLFTSGGATSSFHLLLHLIQGYCGKETAIKTAKLFAIDMDRANQSYFGTFQPAQDHNDELVAMAQQKIEAAYHNACTIEEIIKDVPASRRNIARRFKLVTGITPIEYLQKTRIEAAKKLLEQTNQQMLEIMLNSGYNDPKAFRKIFRKTVGMTPTGYRAKFQAA
ncbi:GlxA family transcriptional regulator [Daejeonella lutea]|uniref:Transcriptional regulator GlxA family, contains an amidase domain and an AraC-type DNA-binding HTH domain n=1 Tax=Daejeonella lutea TaxID=572036 RepID=A0A1T5F7G5_9SPHI|nr:helix-turn-helix domain-containing protein [Daejeonella lutea]SKB92061.1 Transcriptional regulator GlxA family, contains an amidase domain and an AraC-type DNA-binding HTH domain [Daejeonella lutea]